MSTLIQDTLTGRAAAAVETKQWNESDVCQLVLSNAIMMLYYYHVWPSCAWQLYRLADIMNHAYYIIHAVQIVSQ